MGEFYVNEHDAKRAGHHFDLRIKKPFGNKWYSFAVAKGREIPLNPGNKVLLIKTEDHTEWGAKYKGTLDYGYGEGEFKEWDSGKCNLIKSEPKHFIIEFHGKKIKGIYHIIRMDVMMKEIRSKNQFLIFKSKKTKEDVLGESNLDLVNSYLLYLKDEERT